MSVDPDIALACADNYVAAARQHKGPKRYQLHVCNHGVHIVYIHVSPRVLQIGQFNLMNFIKHKFSINTEL